MERRKPQSATATRTLKASKTAKTSKSAKASKTAKASKSAKASKTANGKRGSVASKKAPSNGKPALPVLTDERNQVPCLSCGLCCTYIAVEVDGPDSVRAATDILWYLYHEQVSVYTEDDDWLLQFETRCRNLADDNKCAIYEQRPIVCREFDESGCEVNVHEVGQTFATAAEFLDYLKVHHKRIHTLLSKKYLPGPQHLQRVKRGKLRLPSFEKRYRGLRELGAR